MAILTWTVLNSTKTIDLIIIRLKENKSYSLIVQMHVPSLSLSVLHDSCYLTFPN